MKLLYVDEPKSNREAVQFFLDEASHCNEYDYGDAMREWNRELLYLRSHLKDSSPWVFQKLQQMQNYIQFAPNWDVDSTRVRIIQDANELKEHFILSEMAGRAA
ncbi:MAG: hypothetical protein ACAH59_13655 [Pseudobdellovibrionaceae bacterium]